MRLNKYFFLLVLFSFNERVVASDNESSHNCRELQVTNSIDGNLLWENFTELASDKMRGRKTGSEGSLLAQTYLIKQFQSIGVLKYNDSYLQKFKIKQFFSYLNASNVIGWIPGTENPESYIVITAHYDHLGGQGYKIYNGADDNASGVSGLLSLAAKISHQPLKHSVIFVATDAEEKGLLGARFFLKNPPVNKEQIKLNFNLDMIAYGGRKKRLYVMASNSYTDFDQHFNTELENTGLCLRKGAPNRFKLISGSRLKPDWRRASDHYVFSLENIPHVFFGVDSHKYYHTDKDTAEKINPKFLQAAVESIYRFLLLADTSL